MVHSHRKKRMRQHQAMVKKGLKDPETDDPFELFIAGTNIRYCYYKETHKILGNTYGMCVLQDFEALTPNLLARTIETVEGGGVIVLLLRTMKSLKQLYSMTMDVHARYRTESHNDVTARFNERFILSLSSCENCLVVDDELNILPISAGKKVMPRSVENQDQLTPAQVELKELKESLRETEPAGSLIKNAKTIDQAKAILTFIEAISEKTLKNTVTLTAGRGRGKSAALGIAIAAAIAYGYSNIFVTSPNPENLKTLFEFVFKAFDALGFKEHLDYDMMQSTNPDFNKAVVRVNVFRHHRQTIQYIQPQDAHVLGQAELVVIDEAAAIPLPLVKKLLGNYLVFMASTINGYEGTGRSLSLKLIQQLREQSVSSGASNANKATTTDDSAVGGRILREIKLEEPIRYSANDPAESWLNKLLCLDATVTSRMAAGCPHPDSCELYYVNRDTLFSYHPVSEAFLQRMMALYVASHYKNSPNDLQLMSDAPAHHLFVLLPPINEDDPALPEPLVVLQVCLEGEISRDSILASLSRGKRADGDLIPWTMSQQFQDDDFASLSGARVVRIATHPDYTKMGYGSRALDLLVKYYERQFTSLNETETESPAQMKCIQDEEIANSMLLHTESLQVRDPSSMPPLLLSLPEIAPPNLHWVGVSYGLTSELLRFWKKGMFVPVYLRQTQNELTGEHTCIMLRTLDSGALQYDPKWLSSFWQDFKRRFLHLLASAFRDFSPVTALSVLENKYSALEKSKPLDKDELTHCFLGYDLKRLQSYANNMLDYHVIVDLLSTVAHHFFENRMTVTDDSTERAAVSLSAIQKALLLAMGLQHKTVDAVAKELDVPAAQLLALFIRMCRKFSEFYESIQARAIEKEFEPLIKEKVQKAESLIVGEAKNEDQENDEGDQPKNLHDEEAWDPTKQSLEQDLNEAEKEQITEMKRRQRALVESLNLSQYAIAGSEDAWKSALSEANINTGTLLSVKNPQSSKLKKRKSTIDEVARLGQKMVEKKHKKGSKKQKN